MYLAKPFGFRVFLETEGREMDAISEYASFGQNADTSDTVNLHFHVWVTVRVAEVGQMWSPGGVLGISLNNDSIFIEGICQG